MRILWDFDGTIIDTYPTMVQAALQAVRKHGKEISSQELLDRMKISSIHAFSSLGLDPDELLPEMVQLEKQFPADRKRPFPYIEEVLKLAEVNVIYTHKVRSEVEKLLDQYELTSYFTEIVCWEDGYPRKPDAKAYEYLHQKYSIDLVIGDRELDLVPARQLDIKTCAFQNPTIEADYHLQGYDQFPIILLGERFEVVMSKPSPPLSAEWLQNFFSPEENRYKHIMGVVEKAQGVPEAYLHDIGYAKKLVRTGFHPLDGALFALEHSFSPEVVKAVLFHSGAYGEAKLRGGEIGYLYRQLSPFLTSSDQEKIDFLTYCDIHTSSDGSTVTIEERLADIFARYPEDTVVHRNMKQQRPYLLQLREKYGEKITWKK